MDKSETKATILPTHKKRKLESERSDDKNATTSSVASKRVKTDESSQGKSSTENTEEGGEGEAGSSGPREMSPKHPVNIQNGIYAAERLSCSLDITHSLNFILRGKIRCRLSLANGNSLTICFPGSILYITWSDRENVIRSGGIDILDNLPHFLLVLLIIQRFDLARWGFFTAFEKSQISVITEETWPDALILRANFDVHNCIDIFPLEDPVYTGVNLVGRSTDLAGARRSTDPTTWNTQDIRDGNDIVVKFSWPRNSRDSEVDFIEEAKKIGESNELVKNHIPTVRGHLDPPFVTCSTRYIREFLGLKTDGERVLRVIAFRRLEKIKYLDKEHMLIAYLDAFLCKLLLRLVRQLMGLTMRQVTGLCGWKGSSTGISALGT